jgi:hypothetical protein
MSDLDKALRLVSKNKYGKSLRWILGRNQNECTADRSFNAEQWTALRDLIRAHDEKRSAKKAFRRLCNGDES